MDELSRYVDQYEYLMDMIDEMLQQGTGGTNLFQRDDQYPQSAGIPRCGESEAAV